MKKRVLIIILICTAALILISCVLTVILLKDKSKNDGTAFDELYVRDVLENLTADDIIADSKWGENLADSTDNYIMVGADKFDLTDELKVGGGYSMLYFDKDSRDINMIQHSLVSYTDGKDSRAEIEKHIAIFQNEIIGLLGNPIRTFMLMNTSGEFKDYEGLTVNQMIESILKDDTVMYAMYEHNGIRYEVNIMFSDNTIYTMLWLYERGDS